MTILNQFAIYFNLKKRGMICHENTELQATPVTLHQCTKLNAHIQS